MLRKTIQNAVRKFELLANALNRNTLRCNFVLLAPFDEEKNAMGRALMETVNGSAFDETTHVQPFSKSGAVCYNLPGFYTPAGGATRALLGLPALKGANSTKALIMNTEMPVMENAVALVVLDPTMTPLPKDELNADIPALKHGLGTRVLFVFIHHDKFRSWSPAAQRKREKIWAEILGDAEAYYCETATYEGIRAVVDAMTRARYPK